MSPDDAAAHASVGALPGPGKGKGKGRLTAPGQNKPCPGRPAPTTPVPTTPPVPTQTPTTPVPTTPVPAEGFVPLRTVRDYHAGVAVADGELWLVTGVDGARVLEHHVGDLVTTAPLEGAGLPVLAASGPTDVWLAVGDTLQHYDGATWSAVPWPREAAGRTATAATTDGRGVLLLGVGAALPDVSGRVLRYADGAWGDLGHPGADGTHVTPLRIAPSSRGLALLATGHDDIDTADFVTGAWGPLTVLRLLRFGDASALVVLPGYGQRLALGYSDSGRGFGRPECWVWLPGGKPGECTTTVAATDAEVRAGGDVVIAGRDWTEQVGTPGSARTQTVRGGFALRGADGAEAVVPGDPGAVTDLLAVPGSRTVYALSRSRTDVTSFTLQRYAG